MSGGYWYYYDYNCFFKHVVMNEIINKFYNAYWTPGIKSVFNDKIPKEMMNSEPDKDGWYEWKLMQGTLTKRDYLEVETQFNVVFPETFIEWHKRYFFADCDCSIIRLPPSLPIEPLQELKDRLNWSIPQKLIPE